MSFFDSLSQRHYRVCRKKKRWMKRGGGLFHITQPAFYEQMKPALSRPSPSDFPMSLFGTIRSLFTPRRSPYPARPRWSTFLPPVLNANHWKRWKFAGSGGEGQRQSRRSIQKVELSQTVGVWNVRLPCLALNVNFVEWFWESWHSLTSANSRLREETGDAS